MRLSMLTACRRHRRVRGVGFQFRLILITSRRHRAFTTAAFGMEEPYHMQTRVILYILAINLNYSIQSGRSLAWLGHQVPNLTTRVQIPVTAPQQFLCITNAQFCILLMHTSVNSGLPAPFLPAINGYQLETRDIMGSRFAFSSSMSCHRDYQHNEGNDRQRYYRYLKPLEAWGNVRLVRVA